VIIFIIRGFKLFVTVKQRYIDMKINLNYSQINTIVKASINDSQDSKKQDCTYNGQSSQISLNSAYFIPFLGKKQYSENEQEFLKFRKAFSRKTHKLSVEYSIADWNFYTNSTEENEKILEEKEEEFRKLYRNRSTLEKLHQFQEKGINDAALKRHLKDLIKNFDLNITYEEEIRELSDKERDIARKFNAYRGEVGGQEHSDAELDKMSEEEKNVEKRKEIYRAQNGGGDLIETDLIELVKMRNVFARKLGFSDYFSCKLKDDYEIDEKQFFELLYDLDIKTEKIYEKIKAQNDEKLANAFGIKSEELMPWHYGLMLEDNPYREADKYIKDNGILLPLSVSMYQKMGWKLEDLPIQFDLFPREGKNQHGFCFGIDVPNDVRILANLRNNMGSLETLNHEAGHAVYDAGISDHLPVFDRISASSAMTEAVAMLMESLPYREKDFLMEKTEMPEELMERLDKKRRKDLVNFVRTSLFYINFEKELYENPDQDVKKLWFDMKKKYSMKNIPDKLNNEWATIPHFLSHPAYIQNYLRAEIMAAQMYKSATQKLGPLTQNTATADFFRKKMFRHGVSLDENEIIKRMTGSILKPDAFSEQMKDL